MKYFLSGPITGESDYVERFAEAQRVLESSGCIVMNPACLPQGFRHHEYMEICYRMIDPCDAILLLPGWRESKGANLEYMYAKKTGKLIVERCL